MDYDLILSLDENMYTVSPKQPRHQAASTSAGPVKDPLDADTAVKAFNEFEQPIVALKEQINSITVSDEATSKQIAELGAQAKSLAKTIRKRLDKKLEPYELFISAVRDAVNKFISKLISLQSLAEFKQLPYLQEQAYLKLKAEDVARVEQKRLQDEADADAKAGMPVAPVIVVQPVTPAIKHKTDSGSQGLKTEPGWEVESWELLPAAAFASLERRSHDSQGKTVSGFPHVWIRAQYRAGVNNIPGVRFFERQVVKTRVK